MRYEVMSAIRESDLSTMERAFLWAIESRNNDKNEGYFGTRDKLMLDTGMSRPTVYKIRNALKKKKVLEFEEQGYMKPSVYKVVAENLTPRNVSITEKTPGQGHVSFLETQSDEAKDVKASDQDFSITEKDLSLKKTDLSPRLHTKDNYKKNIEGEQESIYIDIKKIEDSPSEKNGESDGSVADAPSLPNDEIFELEDLPPSSNEEPVRNEPNIEREETVWVDWKTFTWKLPSKPGLDDWTYYPLFKSLNKDMIQKLDKKYTWSRVPAWVAPISDHYFHQDYATLKVTKQEELENQSW